MTDKTKIFISWSGAYTKQVAITLKEWLEDLFDQVDPFVSDRDIEAGQRSMAVIEEQLKDTSFGLVLTTLGNQGSQWINFEAGALSKEIEESTTRVVPLLLDMDSPAQLTGPLAQFQAKVFGRAGMLDIALMVGRIVGVKDEVTRRRFERTFDEAKLRIDAIPNDATMGEDSEERDERPLNDMVEESLTLLREMRRMIRTSGAFSPTRRGVVSQAATTGDYANVLGVRLANAEIGGFAIKVDAPGVIKVELHGPTVDQQERAEEAVRAFSIESTYTGEILIEEMPF